MEPLAQVSTVPVQAATDQQLIDLWLHGQGHHTQRAYRADVLRFIAFTRKPIGAVTLGDLQTFSDSLALLALSSRARILSAIKSLLSFAHRVGYLQFDVGKPLRLPALKVTLAERILNEADVQRILAMESNPRDRAMLLLLYAAGIRVSELVALRWRDVQSRGESGQITVYGKGGKTRAIVLPSGPWKALLALGISGLDAPVFLSRAGGHLDPSQAWRIVRKAALRASIDLSVSPHWLRHAHASHALDRGAPIHLVQATLGHTSVATTGKYLHARPTESSGKYLAV